MARPPKSKLDYAGWSVDIFDTDTKIDKLLDAHGWAGFGVYFYLCQRAYGSDGYFYQWCYADCATTARKMGGGIGAGTVRETVGYCLQVGLFDKGLFDRWGVLTSRGIQSRYWEVAKDRRVKRVIAEYWLLQKDDCEGLLIEPLNTDYSDTNGSLPDANSSLSPTNGGYAAQKESKGKESKVKERKERECARVLDAWNALDFSGQAKIKSISPRSTRERHLTARIQEHGIDGVLKAIDKVGKSSFLKGESDRGWVITFDWLIRQSNMVKVLEGNYDDRPRRKRAAWRGIERENKLAGLMEEIAMEEQMSRNP